MIDAHTEALLSLGQACRAIPGGTVSISTIHRWVLDGVRGAKLETIKVGHRRLTSREAITRFIQAQNPESTTEPAITSSHHIQPATSTVQGSTGGTIRGRRLVVTEPEQRSVIEPEVLRSLVR